MTYDPATRQLDLNARPTFIVTDPATMTHFHAMLHHRVSWNRLGTALNRVLSGAADRRVVNALLRMSPGNSLAVINGFATALNQVLANRGLTDGQQAAIETVEQLVFSLPCNLFLGMSARADDPADGIDFLPGDVNADGTLPRADNQLTPLGALQQQREELANRLANLTGPQQVDDLARTCAAIVNLWAAQTPDVPAAGLVPALRSLHQATGFTAALWAPGAAPYASPPYRNWPGPLTAAQSAALNDVVQRRVDRLN